MNYATHLNNDRKSHDDGLYYIHVAINANSSFKFTGNNEDFLFTTQSKRKSKNFKCLFYISISYL